MSEFLLGPPQIAALLVLGQRGLEELYSARNTRRLLSEGGYEVGRSFYPVVAVTHLGWLASVFLLIPPGAAVSYPMIAVYLALQGARYWIISSLGRFWTHRSITVDGAPIVNKGPYKFLRHPNYVLTIAEVFVLPSAFGAWALAAIMATIWTSVVSHRMRIENEALQKRAPAAL
jgi:methyltransferase